MRKILHICPLDKFIPAFIEFVEKNFEFEHHIFVLIGDIKKYPVHRKSNIIHINQIDSRAQLYLLLARMHLAKKIILHSIFERNTVNLLFKAPWLLRKCYWVMWGGDLYHHQSRTRDVNENRYENIRACVIRKMGHFVTYVKGDYELAQKWYGAKGEYHECLMYPSNLYKEYVVPPKKNEDQLCVLLGNSADPSNNHNEMFEKLLPYKNKNVLIYCPLSYGLDEYAERIAKLGKTLFGDKFIPLLEFIPFEKYLELLGQIDIAVFAHNRQQGMGNTITLLGLGKKVFMRSDVTQWRLFEEIGVKVFDVEEFSLESLADDTKRKNIKQIEGIFSEKNLIEQYSKIFR